MYPDPVQSGYNKRKQKNILYWQSVIYDFLIFGDFAYFSLDSTLLVHFDFPNFLVSLQNKKTSENKRVNNFTWFDTHLGT